MQRKTLILLAVVGLVWIPLLMGQQSFFGTKIQPVNIAQPQVEWQVVATIEDVNATFGVDDRLYSSVSAVSDPNFVIWTVPSGWRTAELRFRGEADSNSYVVEAWVCHGDTMYNSTLSDSFMLGDIYTLTGGTQVGPNSDVYCDTCVATGGALWDSSVDDSANNRVSVVTINLLGAKYVAFIATTLSSSDSIIVEARHLQ